MTDEAADGFLSRWSRRKRAAVKESPAVEAATAPAADTADTLVVDPAGIGAGEPPATGSGSVWTVDATGIRPAEAGEAGPLPVIRPFFDPASLPALETLTATSDITGFLRAEVPAALRRAALRRIWTLDVGIRDFIGPADYAWDYNAPDGVPGFALHLGGDAQKLLAQAMGWEPQAMIDKTAGTLPNQALPEDVLPEDAQSDVQSQDGTPLDRPSPPSLPLAADTQPAIAASPDACRSGEHELHAPSADRLVPAGDALRPMARRHGTATPT